MSCSYEIHERKVNTPPEDMWLLKCEVLYLLCSGYCHYCEDEGQRTLQMRPVHWEREREREREGERERGREGGGVREMRYLF